MERLKTLALIAGGIASGAAYGLFVRWGSRLFPSTQVFAVMTVGFLFFVPFGVGFVSVYIIERKRSQPIWMWLLVSSGAVVLALAGTIMAYWEGFICVVMFAPIGLLTSMVGGVIAGAWMRLRRERATHIPVACVMILPLLVTPWEEHVLRTQEVLQVESVVDIHASPDEVWRNIERVPRIRPAELRPSWSHRIGFPNPVEATLSHEGTGGVRHATFEGGILFVETVDLWEPQQKLGFSIRADTADIPPTTLDEHVTVGGKFFDVLYGEYVLDPQPNGIIRLHLISRHRVSTDFNWYAHLWTDAVMRDLQQRILLVVKNRAESATHGPM
jgi:hypothetical protein